MIRSGYYQLKSIPDALWTQISGRAPLWWLPALCRVPAPLSPLKLLPGEGRSQPPSRHTPFFWLVLAPPFWPASSPLPQCPCNVTVTLWLFLMSHVLHVIFLLCSHGNRCLTVLLFPPVPLHIGTHTVNTQASPCNTALVFLCSSLG